jgi:lysyl-tRNA synthetase class 2
MPKVSSSAIRRIDYEPGLRKLLVIFQETGAYTYFDVPRPVYEEFLDAPSKGQFFNEKIRDRYPTERVR